MVPRIVELFGKNLQTMVLSVAAVAAIAILAAVLFARMSKRRQHRKKYDKMSVGFRLGFYAYSLFFWRKLAAVRGCLVADKPKESVKPVPTDGCVSINQETADKLDIFIGKSIDQERDKCRKLATQLGIKFSAEALIREDMKVDELPEYKSEIEANMSALSRETRCCVEAGSLLGSSLYRVWFMLSAKEFARRYQMKSNAFSDLDQCVDEICRDLIESESLFERVGLNKRILRDLRRTAEWQLSHIWLGRIGSSKEVLFDITRIDDAIEGVAARIGET